MFDGLLKIAPRCDVCGADFDKADVGDGASVFVMFIVGFLAVILYLLVEVAFSPPWWVHLIFQIPFIPHSERLDGWARVSNLMELLMRGLESKQMVRFQSMLMMMEK